MSEAMARVLEQALALPPDEREEVAERLMDSVDEDGPPGLELGSDEFWAEIQRRSDEAHAHPERLLDGEQVNRNVREHLARLREAAAAASTESNGPDRRADMSNEAATLMTQAMELSVDDWRDMVDHLQFAIDRAEEEPDPEFDAEIARRSDEAHAHPERLIPWEVAREQIHAELERRRAARAAGEQP